MTPAARVAAAITILDQIIAGDAAEHALLRWSRRSRFAGSTDRQAVRDLVFDTLRRRRSRAARGGGLSGRALMIGMCREQGLAPETLFGSGPYAPPPLTAEESQGHDPTADDLLDLPDWIIERFRRDLGASADAIAATQRERAPVWLRVNVLKATAQQAQSSLGDEGIEATMTPLSSTALLVAANSPRITTSDAYKRGLIELQDLSPQLACAAIGVRPGERILDYCAGGGGKSLAMAGMGGRVTAHDADPQRMTDLPTRAARAGVRISILRDVRQVRPFDRVVADVPCSGSGTWRRTPEMRWRLSDGGLGHLTALQASILQQAAGLVAPGGELDYMTCSFFADENESQIASFLNQMPMFTLIHQQRWDPTTASDGFFLARLRRVNQRLTSGAQDCPESA